MPIFLRRNLPGGPREILATNIFLAMISCAHGPPPPAPRPGFALQKTTPAEVCMPAGEQLWLSRLRCPDGQPIKIVAREAAGARAEPELPDDPRPLQQLDVGLALAPGEPDFHIVEAVTVSCSDRDRTLFLDMYHCAANPPLEAPEGLSIEPLELKKPDE